MPQGRGSAKAKRKKAPAKPPKTDAPKVDGMLVQVVDDGDGGQTLNIQALGTVKVAECPTLLRKAANVAEKQLTDV